MVYIPALQNGFVNWDDNRYVYENRYIGSLDFRFLKWSLSAVVASLWHPLTMFSLALDHAIWGLNPSGFHLTNIIFHVINTVLVFILIIQLIGYGNPGEVNSKKLTVGITTAILFGIHPLHVESVAWISERKDVLSAFFFLSSILFYIKYASTKRRIFYAASFISFIMALMSKPMAVSLPLVLLILDYYPLRRYESRYKRLILEKIPFFAGSVLFSLITIWAHVSYGGGIKTLESFPLTTRLFMAVRTMVFYLLKMILPFNIAPYYPYPKVIRTFELEYLGAFALIAIIVWSLKKRRLYFTVWLYYIVTLIPVIGILQVGTQAAADRYTYLPSLGPFLLLGLSAGAAFEMCSGRSRAAFILSLFIVTGLLMNKTVTQIAMWKDSITLWSSEIRLFPNTAEIAYNNRGSAYDNKGKTLEAIKDYTKAIEIKPGFAEAYLNRGTDYFSLGYYSQAIEDFNTSIKLNPKYFDSYYNRGITYNQLGRYQEAIRDYSMAVKFNPGNADAYSHRGYAYSKLKDDEGAVKDYTISIRLEPKKSIVYKLRGISYGNMGDRRHALDDFTMAVELNPQDTEARYYLKLAQDAIH